MVKYQTMIYLAGLGSLIHNKISVYTYRVEKKEIPSMYIHIFLSLSRKPSSNHQ